MKICRLLRAQSRAVAAEIRKATWSRAWGFYVISSSWVLGCEQESCKPIRSCFVVLRLWCSTPILVWSIYFSSSWYFIFHDTFRTSKHEDLNIINGQLMKLDQRCFTVCGYPRCKSLGAVQYILHFLLFTKHGQTTQASMQDLVCQLAKLAHRYHDSKIERWARKSVNCFLKLLSWKWWTENTYTWFFFAQPEKNIYHTHSQIARTPGTPSQLATVLLRERLDQVHLGRILLVMGSNTFHRIMFSTEVRLKSTYPKYHEFTFFNWLSWIGFREPRLAFGVGSGHYGVRHSHHVAETYDSDLFS